MVQQFRAWLTRLALRVDPSLSRLIRTADSNITRLAGQNDLLRERIAEQRRAIEIEARDYREAIMLMTGGWVKRGAGVNTRESLTSVRESDSTAVVQCREYLSELEMDLRLDDAGWREIIRSHGELSLWAHQRMMAICRLYWIKNPLIHCGIEHSAHYVFARGFEVSSPDAVADQVLRDFFLDPRNRSQLGQAELVRKEVSYNTDGHLYWSFHTDPSDGQTLVRGIDPCEIEETIYDPQDSSTPWFYKRRWNESEFSVQNGPTLPTPKDGWYVALGAREVDVVKQTKSIKGVQVITDKAGNQIPIYHRSAPLGIPPVYGAIEWARAITVFMTDWCTVHRQLSRIVQTIETQGGAPAVAAWKSALSTTLAAGGIGVERNPTPVTGSTLVHGPTDKLSNVRASGMTDSPEAARRLWLMLAAHFGLPETFFSDASTGSLATALSLDQPTRLKFMERQECWREDLQVMGHYALTMSLQTGKGRLREALMDRGIDPDKVTLTMTPRRDPHFGNVWVYEANKPAKRAIGQNEIVIDVKFPEILENDVRNRIEALAVAAKTGMPLRVTIGLMLSEFGVEDIETILDKMDAELAKNDAAMTENPLPAQPSTVPQPQVNGHA